MIKTCLITGGAGFIGSHLSEELLKRGFRVICIDNFAQGTYQNLQRCISNPNFRFVELDITSEAFSHHLSSFEVDYIFHLACPVGVSLVMKTGFDLFDKHYDASLVLFEWAKKHSIPLFYASSSEVYGNPFQAEALMESDAKPLDWFAKQSDRFYYGRLKRSLELYLEQWATKNNISVTIGRFFNVFGPRQQASFGMVIPRFIEAAKQNKPLTIFGDGSQIRSFCPIPFAINSIIELTFSNKSKSSDVFNIGLDSPVSILELAKSIIQFTDSTSVIEFSNPLLASGRNEGIHIRIPSLKKLKSSLKSYMPLNWESYLNTWIQQESNRVNV